MSAPGPATGPAAPLVTGSDVTTSDGVRLRVHQSGKAGAPTVLCVHGYPDDHTVWDAVAAELGERYHVARYDVRGAGASEAPRGRRRYRLDQLADDLAAVADAVSPDRPVHLLGHDWGAVQIWHALGSGRLAGRVASFTSISGPCLDYIDDFIRSRLRRPTPRALRELAVQLVSSWYVGFFQLPVLPELSWRAGIPQRVLARWGRGPRPPARADGSNGLALYRANLLTRTRRSRPAAVTVPVQVLAPRRDPAVSVPLQADIARWVPDLAVRVLPAGHWVPVSHPETVARCAGELVEHAEGAPEPRGLRRARAAARTRRRGGRFTDELVVITGAGSGIGRACALELAERGAEVVVTDLDPDAAERTALLARLLGATAHAYQLDVTDGEAFSRLADLVRERHGIPDIAINNAGIGVAGPFLATDPGDWERIVDVNLWGVIHGCRALGGLMASGGTGGSLVNIASAAAYLPSPALSAYATTKAAVLALSQCLRGELAEAGVDVIAVCPGFVHTDITRTTRFAGLDRDHEHAAQQRITRLYRLRNYPPQRAARQILRAIERNRAVAPVTPEATVGLVASRITPALLRSAIARLSRTETLTGRHPKGARDDL